MNSLLRITTLIFLLIALSTLTGIAQAAATLVVAVEASLPCCPEETPVADTPLDLPCCTLGCHCFACQGVELSGLFSFLKTSLEVLLQHPSPLASIPSGHGLPIDYPPETA